MTECGWELAVWHTPVIADWIGRIGTSETLTRLFWKLPSTLLKSRYLCHVVSHWEDRNMITTILLFELTVASHLRMTVKNRCLYFSLYPICIYPLSLSLSLKLKKTKEQKRRKTFMFMDCSFMIYLTRWRCISMCSKRLIYFNVPTWSKLVFAVSSTSLLCHISFPASIRLMLSCLKLSYWFLKNSYTGNRNCRLL